MLAIVTLQKSGYCPSIGQFPEISGRAPMIWIIVYILYPYVYIYIYMHMLILGSVFVPWKLVSHCGIVETIVCSMDTPISHRIK